MGAWSFNILGDDTSRDVYDDYFEHYNVGKSHGWIVAKLRKSYRWDLRDPDEGPLVWLGIAKAQWDAGGLQKSVLAQIDRIVRTGLGLERWKEQGDAALAKRTVRLKAFAKQLRTKNGSPKRPKPPRQREPAFERGSCLAIKLPGGKYGAAIVLDAEKPGGSSNKETYGENLVGLLSYNARKAPDAVVFKSRRWLRRPWGATRNAWCST